MKTPYKSIYSVLKINRFIVLTAVCGAVITSLYFGWMVFDIHRNALNNAFAINTDGSVIPLKWITQKENLEIEAKAHLELFHTYFYNINATNYERNLEKALWLGNSSVDNVYRQKKADGVYNRLLQYSLVQKVINIESEVNIELEPYAFRTKTVFEINRGKTIDRYELVSSGNLINVDRNFPKNTHGLLITNYFENTLKKLEDEN
ncbi:conjugal transfer protein TraK [Salegentibacter maritimus]|uniref:conjugal transfer protein TraK n=1 Tax=Salegentibacter maritimus TaxID=2794347 RepID=UPI0018E4B99C|nr:conjugal transfer protein TraK [Salegentibacter maritimus]MBI6116004.1 conjugal transfer protein TraK [Salegentibacter maritimus]